MGAVLFLLVAGGVLTAIAIVRANARRGVSRPDGTSIDTGSDGGYVGAIDSGSSMWSAGSDVGSDSGSCDAASSDGGGSDCGGGDSGGSSGGD